MDSDSIPDDVWITIFETVDDPDVLATLLRVCHRFYDLASKPLLRELKWVKHDSTARNISAWGAGYSNLRSLTRKITLGIPFEFPASALRHPSIHLTPDMQLHDQVHQQLAMFPNLTEIIFDGAAISPYTYTVLATIPTLQRLQVHNCALLPIHESFQARQQQALTYHMSFFSQSATPANPPAPPPFQQLAITHFALSRNSISPEFEMGAYNPLCILAAPNLTSVSLSWTAAIAARYGHSHWVMPNVTVLDLDMPLLTRDLLDALAGFIDRCTRGPRVQLRIEKHNLSEAQLGSVVVPLRGVWNFEGPLGIAACTAAKSVEPSLTRVIMNEPLDLTALLDGMEKLPETIEELELHVRYWDMEVLFAVRQLFKSIRRLTIKYIRGNLAKDFLVILGADILAHLPRLHTLRIMNIAQREDAHATRVNRPTYAGNFSQWTGLQNHFPYGHHSHHGHPTFFGGSTLGGTGGVSGGGGSGGTSTSGNSHVGSLASNRHHTSRKTLKSTFRYDSEFDWDEDETERQIIEATLQESLDDVIAWEDRGQMDVDIIPSTSAGPGTSSSAANTSASAVHSHTVNGFIDPSPPPSPSELSSYAGDGWYRRRRHDFGNVAGPSISQSSVSSTTSHLQPADDSLEVPLIPDPRLEALRAAQSELGDYLVGWSRYCLSLRAVQIEDGWWWERRFEGDRWVLRGPSTSRPRMGTKTSRKGKERET